MVFSRNRPPPNVDVWLSNDLENVELTVAGSAAATRKEVGILIPSSSSSTDSTSAGYFKRSWFNFPNETDSSSLEISKTSDDSLKESSKKSKNRRCLVILFIAAFLLIVFVCSIGFVAGFVAGKSRNEAKITDSVSESIGSFNKNKTTPASEPVQDAMSNDVNITWKQNEETGSLSVNPTALTLAGQETPAPTSSSKSRSPISSNLIEPATSTSLSPTKLPTLPPTTLSPTMPPQTLLPTVSPKTSSPTMKPTEPPTKYPTPYPTTILPTIAPTTLSPTILVEPRPTSPTMLQLCEGPCDSDEDCDGNLKCLIGSIAIQRQAPANCPGELISEKRYCYDIDESIAPSEPPVLPPTPADMLSLHFAGDNGGSAFPLGLCEGDCDGDYECDAGYLCFDRDGLEDVPGCEKQGISRKDYCYQPDSKMSGPIVGHTTHYSTTIWAFQGQRKVMQLSYWHGEQTKARTVEMHPRASANNAALVQIRGLRASTTYTYELYVEGATVAGGHFTTAPAPGPVKFEYLLASCINLRDWRDQPVWDAVLQRKPAFSMLAGDTVYLNEEDWDEDTRRVSYGRTWIRNMEQRAETHFAKILRSVPTYSAWDDHEYGVNNADRYQPGKENTLKAFKDLWANPYNGVSEIEGTFYDYYWGDVHFIVLDNRWYRDESARTQLGDKQKLWLYDTLLDSAGVFKVLVNGCDIMERGFDQDINDIGNFVTANKISGVIFNAGDIHRNEFKAAEYGTWPYRLTQFSSSGIARNNWMRPWAMIKVDTELADPEITAYFYGADSQMADTTWSNDPNLKCSNIEGVDRYKEARCTETIRLSDLTSR